MVAVVHSCLVVVGGVGHRLLLTLEDGDVMPAPCKKPGNVETEDTASNDRNTLSQFCSLKKAEKQCRSEYLNFRFLALWRSGR